MNERTINRLERELEAKQKLINENERIVYEQTMTIAAQAAQIARLREALEPCLSALQRAKPQIKGVLVIQDVDNAITRAARALEEVRR